MLSDLAVTKSGGVEAVCLAAAPEPNNTTALRRLAVDLALHFKMRFLLPLLLSFVSSIHALHFYLDANQQRCFIEELPTDTVVEGMRHISAVCTKLIARRPLPCAGME